MPSSPLVNAKKMMCRRLQLFTTSATVLLFNFLLQNVCCQNDRLSFDAEDHPLIKRPDVQSPESQLSMLSLPMAKEMVNILSKHRQQSPLSRLPIPPINNHNNNNNPTRPNPHVANGQASRPHFTFQQPTPRFTYQHEPSNQIDLSAQQDDIITAGGSGIGIAIKDNNEQWPLPMPETPKILHLDVKCDKNYMKVSIEFDRPFNGMIFSKGHYNYRNCVYLPANTGRKNVFFDISINACGTSGNAQGTFYNEDVAADSGQFFENTVVIQYDPQVQEAWDQARKLRCTWHDSYEKSVSFRPFPVDMLDVVRADFAGDNVGCWMQIQVGKGPWASEVAGIVKIGQTMTMVLAIKDEENKFDMLVRNCIAHDGKRAPIELVDGNGCIVRSKLMTKFTKIRNFGSSASVLSYTHFQAFKFPDSMEVHFQCTIQICRFQCPDQCTQQPGSDVINLYHQGDGIEGGDVRKRRDIHERVVTMAQTHAEPKDSSQVGLDKTIQVVSPRDLSFTLESDQDSMALVENAPQYIPTEHSICIPAYGFIISIFASCVVCAFAAMVTLALCRRSSLTEKEKFDKEHFHTMAKLPNLYEMIRVK